MKPCNICNYDDDDSIDYGDFMVARKIRVHYYCLLLSTNLPQKGKDFSGILGFLLIDIKREIKNAAKRTCYICKKNHASIKCYECGKYFHLVCGTKGNCLSQFFDDFRSFCDKHSKINTTMKHVETAGCYICLDSMGPYNPITSMHSYCCQKGWIHRKCLRRYAIAAGYYLKCLWCSNTQFRNDIRNNGVFVPDRDALWEQKDAFAGLHCGYSMCDMTDCLCPQGRNHNPKNGKWIIFVCYSCGAKGTHKFCSEKPMTRNTFMCKECCNILNKTKDISIINSNKAHNQTLFMTKSQLRFNDDPANFGFGNETDFEPINIENNENNSEVITPISSTYKESRDDDINCTNKLADYQQYLIIDAENKKIIGCAEAKPKENTTSEFFRSDSLEINNFVLSSDLSESTSFDGLFKHLLDEIVINHRKEKNSQIIDVSDSDEDDSPDQLLEKLLNEMPVGVPKPKSEKEELEDVRMSLLREKMSFQE